MGFFSGIKNLFNKVRHGIGSAWGKVKDTASNVWGKVEGVAKKVYNALPKPVKDLVRKGGKYIMDKEFEIPGIGKTSVGDLVDRAKKKIGGVDKLIGGITDGNIGDIGTGYADITVG